MGFTFRVVLLQVTFLYTTLFSIKLYQYFGTYTMLIKCFDSTNSIHIKIGKEALTNT